MATPPLTAFDSFAARTIAERRLLAARDPDGEADSVAPIRRPTMVELATAWDAEISTPLPDVDVEYPIPEDRGQATLSELGTVEYVEDLVRPGRIMVVAAEEGTGKSYAIDTELGIRIAVAGGSFAGTWPIVANGPVLVMSEMHGDDDYDREAAVLASLQLERSALAGCYYRLPLMTAAGGEPALVSDRWLAWIARWLSARNVFLLVVDTATGASQVDPWGREIQGVYRRLRGLLEDCPHLAIALIVHFKKPAANGGDRRLSDVLGEWGRWSDVVMLLERDGTTRTKVSTRKRVRVERRISATKAGGLLVDPVDLDEDKGTKVQPAAVLEAIAADPGIGFADLGVAIGVSKDTASRYVRDLGAAVELLPTGPRGAIRVYLTAAPPQTTAQAGYGGHASDPASVVAGTAATPQHRIGAAVPAAVVIADASADDGGYGPSAWCRNYSAHQSAHRHLGGGRWICDICTPPGQEA
jgi:AAA domain